MKLSVSPVSSGTRLGDLPALLASLPRLSRDEAEAFAEDLVEAREQLRVEDGATAPA